MDDPITTVAPDGRPGPTACLTYRRHLRGLSAADLYSERVFLIDVVTRALARASAVNEWHRDTAAVVDAAAWRLESVGLEAAWRDRPLRRAAVAPLLPRLEPIDAV